MTKPNKENEPTVEEMSAETGRVLLVVRKYWACPCMEFPKMDCPPLAEENCAELYCAALSLIEHRLDSKAAHELLKAENLARKKHIEHLTVCRDHWKASYEERNGEYSELILAVSKLIREFDDMNYVYVSTLLSKAFSVVEDILKKAGTPEEPK